MQLPSNKKGAASTALVTQINSELFSPLTSLLSSLTFPLDLGAASCEQLALKKQDRKHKKDSFSTLSVEATYSKCAHTGA